ncbi:hypothetical protein K9M41_01410 [Candidatus Gracilibacteria bacterium]|nr:hypothetical protein [Candidatus Gracilibacteria bacterium]
MKIYTDRFRSFENNSRFIFFNEGAPESQKQDTVFREQLQGLATEVQREIEETGRKDKRAREERGDLTVISKGNNTFEIQSWSGAREKEMDGASTYATEFEKHGENEFVLPGLDIAFSGKEIVRIGNFVNLLKREWQGKGLFLRSTDFFYEKEDGDLCFVLSVGPYGKGWASPVYRPVKKTACQAKLFEDFFPQKQDRAKFIAYLNGLNIWKRPREK